MRGPARSAAGTGSARTPRSAARPRPGVTARSAPDLERVRRRPSTAPAAGWPCRQRGAQAAARRGSPRRCRSRPSTAAGLSSGLLLGASASIRLSTHEARPARSSRQSRPASATRPSTVCAGRQVGLHEPAQQRVLASRPGRRTAGPAWTARRARRRRAMRPARRPDGRAARRSRRGRRGQARRRSAAPDTSGDEPAGRCRARPRSAAGPAARPAASASAGRRPSVVAALMPAPRGRRH